MPPLPSTAAPMRLTTPVPRELTGEEGALDLLPIPAMLCDCVNGRTRTVATNDPFRAAVGDGPRGVAALAGLLEARVAALVAAGGERDVFAVQLGEEVDGRHYRSTVARVRSRGIGRGLGALVDRSSELRTERSLRREMTTDSLTGLPNRGGFTDRLEAMPPAERARQAIMVVDLERFSRINACLGGLTGDELLISVARRLKGALRAPDVLARIGADEFGILLRIEDGPVEAEHVAKRLRGALAAPFRLCDYEIRVSCAIGIAFGDGGDDPEDVIRHAQFAAKSAKASGQTEAYRPDAFHAVRARFGLETALRRAIETEQLRLSFQPICDLATGRVKGFESLTRWTDEDGREHRPSDFITVAEESGLIVPLGRWALAEAARTLAEWDRRAGGDCGVTVAVNLSPIQLQRDAVVPLVEAALSGNGLAGERLSLELTESALIAEPDRIARTLEQLRALGAGLAMDDFGTGYSNLGYLQRLPIDTLKIDKSFVSGMLADADKVAIVRAVLSLAQALGKSTVAEGVESLGLAQTLAALGCTWGQGYHFSRPLPADNAYRLIVERNSA